LDRVNARTLTDTHRRALCAAAAFTFGLAYELWAKEEVEDPHRESADDKPAKPAAKVVKPSVTTKPAQAKTPKQEDVTPETAEVEPPMTKEDRDEIIAVIGSLKTTNPTAFAQFDAEFRSAFDLSANSKIAPAIQTAAHGEFIQKFLASLPQA
jgi:hypothetical protein